MRKIFALFVAAVISLGVVGCGEEKKAPVAPPAPTKTEVKDAAKEGAKEAIKEEPKKPDAK